MEMQDMRELEMPTEIPTGDKLETMLNMQHEINQKIYPIVMQNLRMGAFQKPSFTEIEKELLTKEYLLAVIRECCEAMDLINCKPWKKTHKEIDIENFKYEIIDIQHFINSVYDIWEMDSNEVMKYYISKNKENHNRVERNY